MSEQYENFEDKLSKRVELWESIIRDSIFSKKAKDQLLLAVDKIPREEEISRGDLMALFENLRDDLWDFYQEINR